MNPPPPRYLGVMYITLTGLIDSMVPVSGPWEVLVSPNLVVGSPYWARGPPPASSQEPPTGWIPDSMHLYLGLQLLL
ncbi:hypothetical protein DSO57_1033250 [Entomophthora muscae]|uniref:Uncharacterized protein n=1 Tax=Entomophthora muscae TaxID=34485 RepID=A0ACC2SD59_9FUNG|nr:hypothetical protein DSO57_1033250 [Entomophthora muscae]